MHPAEPLRICRITTHAKLAPYRVGLAHLLCLYRDVLLPDSRLTDAQAAQMLTDNTASCIPLLWLITDAHRHVLGAAVLIDCQPGQQACLHGVTHPVIRRHAAIAQLALTMFQLAFDVLDLQTLRAEFAANNRGALGFCRRMKFRRATTATSGNEVAYVLTRAEWQVHLQRQLQH